uniref:Putative broad-complex core protein isoform 1/2/3/4/5 isoform x2 n=1 Tax=Nyssomyia neivai TaxID=330878 RepID=A0A1L8DBE6_9DIPT
MDEFALCWNNFQDNIATGFQNLFDRGDLVDVSLACDGKILRAHKIVLAICSPYFQEMFITNPCKHPIIILKDVTYTVMSELLQFMYQGEVNVKHTELSSFMKIAETLQIKGLTTTQRQSEQRHNSVSPKCNVATTESPQVPVSGSNNNVIETKINTSGYGKEVGAQKRPMDFTGEGFSIYPRKQMRPRTSEGQDEGEMHSTDSMDHMAGDEVFLPPIPQISMGEPRFDLNNVKRENVEALNSLGPGRTPGAPGFNLEYSSSVYLNKNVEYPNELHMANDFSKSSIHMDIPAVSPGDKWFHGKLEFMLSQRGKPLLVHDGYTFGIQYIRKDKKYWQCNLSRKFNCKARVTTTDLGEIIVTNNEHCHTEIRQHLRKDYKQKIANTSSSSSANPSNWTPNRS